LRPLWLQETAQPEADAFVRRVKARALHLGTLCTKPTPPSLTFCLDARLRAGGYPQYILTKAAEPELNDDNESIENIFFPLYDKILYYWFPPTEGYDVCPKWTIPDCRRIEDFSINYVIEHHNHPLLLIEIEPPSDFQFKSARSVAISQVMIHLDEVGPTNLHVD
jgi:hypothetical protein